MCVGWLSVSTSWKHPEDGRIWGNPTEVWPGLHYSLHRTTGELRPSFHLPPCASSSPFLPISQLLLTLWAGLGGGGKGAVAKNSSCRSGSLLREEPQLLLAFSLGTFLTLLSRAGPGLVWLCLLLPLQPASFLAGQSLIPKGIELEGNSSIVRAPLCPMLFLVLHTEWPELHELAPAPHSCLPSDPASQTQAGGQDTRGLQGRQLPETVLKHGAAEAHSPSCACFFLFPI